VGVDRPFDQLEIRLLLVKYGHAHNIRGKQVRGKLEPLKIAPQRQGQSLHQGGLAASRQVIEKHMASGENGHQNQVNLPAFPHDDLLCLCLQEPGVFRDGSHSYSSRK
jgi:hypothetical protein